jgi:hypothetical protein
MIECIPIDSTNVTITHSKKDKTYSETCYCENDPDCPDCKGSGNYTTTVLGFEKAEFLGSNLKEYLTAKFLKVFRLK